MTGSQRNITGVVAGLVLALGACTESRPDPGSDPTPSASPASARPALDARMSAARAVAEDGLAAEIPGILVIATDGDEQRVLELGLAITEPPLPVSADLPFKVASLTKPMVATAVMRLVERGELRLADTVEDVVPGLLAYGGRVTVEQLLSHYSGLREAEPFIGRRPVPDRAVARELSEAGLDSDPGLLPYYRNSNYLVLGLVVEEITGQPLDQALDALVFTPAKMRTAVLVRRVASDRTVVHGYSAGKDVTHRSISRAPAGGGVVASAQDADRFAEALFDGGLVEDQTLEQMTAGHGMGLVAFDDYGLGLAMVETDCGRAYGHSGRHAGYASELWVIPYLDRRVVVMANHEGPATEETVYRTRDAALCG
jgi:D-alanyl-D-alanine carboxypeptidase